MSELRRPIIVIGMHRSGTSMITNWLEILGCFMGSGNIVHNESMFFIDLNDWILRQSGASWDNPASIHYLLNNREVRELVVQYLGKRMRSVGAARFWGLRYAGVLQKRSYKGVWGWKDPRNTFTLPLWLDLYPDAKVIHVSRHGIDVAQSLVRRHEYILRRKKTFFERYAYIYHVVRKESGFTDTVVGASLSGAFNIWRNYMEEAKSHVENMGDSMMDIRYEDCIQAPEVCIKRLADFCCLESQDEKIKTISES
ncbi:MAG: sulfotransferase, partial [Candidatus Pacearchaeota archaeon]|nr:sulfotransferase [Candidatus Pacearchaeota archaeon]